MNRQSAPKYTNIYWQPTPQDVHELANMEKKGRTYLALYRINLPEHLQELEQLILDYQEPRSACDGWSLVQISGGMWYWSDGSEITDEEPIGVDSWSCYEIVAICDLSEHLLTQKAIPF